MPDGMQTVTYRGIYGSRVRKSQSAQVNGSTSGRDDIGPDLPQRHDVTGLCALSDAEAGEHERDEKESKPRRRTAD